MKGLGLTPVGKGDAAAHLRPTSDRVRESLFNLLQNGRAGDRVQGARVLDVFAGTGALGLEALSRGAAHVTFVDDGRAATKLIRTNIAKAKSGPATHLITRNALSLGPCPDAAFDLIFLDPPYGKGLGEKALTHLADHGWIANSALIVWEEGAEMPELTGFLKQDARRYGDTHITFLACENQG